METDQLIVKRKELETKLADIKTTMLELLSKEYEDGIEKNDTVTDKILKDVELGQQLMDKWAFLMLSYTAIDEIIKGRNKQIK